MYYVVEITKLEGQPSAKAVTEKEDIKSAEMLFHQVMASALANENVEEVICTILNSEGRQMPEFARHYIKPQPLTDIVDVTEE